jgi:hypothetical protein
VRALECRVEGASLAIPVENVGQIVEFELSPLPLSQPGVRGLALIDGKLVVALGVAGARGERRQTKGVLLRTADASERWVLEVVEVMSFVDVTAPDRRDGGRVTTDDSRQLLWLDVEQLVKTVNVPGTVGAAE